MNTGAEKGFYGPTNKENAVGAKRRNFLIERPKFEPKKPPKERKAGDPPLPQFVKMAIPPTLAGSNYPRFRVQDQRITLTCKSLPSLLIRQLLQQISGPMRMEREAESTRILFPLTGMKCARQWQKDQCA